MVIEDFWNTFNFHSNIDLNVFLLQPLLQLCLTVFYSSTCLQFFFSIIFERTCVCSRSILEATVNAVVVVAAALQLAPAGFACERWPVTGTETGTGTGTGTGTLLQSKGAAVWSTEVLLLLLLLLLFSLSPTGECSCPEIRNKKKLMLTFLTFETQRQLEQCQSNWRIFLIKLI